MANWLLSRQGNSIPSHKFRRHNKGGPRAPQTEVPCWVGKQLGWGADFRFERADLVALMGSLPDENKP